MNTISSKTRDEVCTLVKSILGRTFDGEKAVVREMHDRLNFACPFCGDSETDRRKKRANIYWDTLRFCCFNSGCPHPRGNLMQFLSKFGMRPGSMESLEEVSSRIAASPQREKSEITYTLFNDLVERAVGVDEFCLAMSLERVERSDRASRYLKGREMWAYRDHFRWDGASLYLLNLSADGRVLGYQVRRSGSGPKYMSYNLERVAASVGRSLADVPAEQLARLNTLSLYFGLLRCDFSKPVNVFEGFIDSCHLPNSIAITGLSKDIGYFSAGRARFFLDNDVSGRRKAEKLMRAGRPVFMWGKYLEDIHVDKEIKDFNELVVFCRRNGRGDPPSVEGYFSDDPLDLLSV